MKIIKYNEGDKHPISLRDAVNHLFEQSFLDPFSHLMDEPFMLQPFNRNTGFFAKSLPSIDVSETAKEFKVEANVPGYDPKNIDVEISGNKLIIKGKMEEDKEEKEKKYYCRERSFGEFYREIALPNNLDISKIECKHKHGTISIAIHKKEPRDNKKVKIDIE